ncbi:efflux RND transporter periplasmic adaptor subunit [Verrucomicrobiaceae bacterium 5K15]|uniref:Efflux RND transporter periplasmic adaptor subunit n=1 Tax=Oceaniferula flava TaxID=2800421 RepID=A0AAE2SCP1_9BACT|nr:efflux RND transporter periplasmic adaptor subunit [Oceaniferula flavus]MBK1854582.1 efflux RND transporter periplasmic adaptor subunit [Oceaniferula flavus]MBM1135888.1 efflux RND transporter periplasmic adaptor subunit [Oceaniferula flavus]
MRKIIHLVIALLVLGAGFLAFNSLKGCKTNAFSRDETAEDSKSSSRGKGNRGGSRRSGKAPSIKTKVLPLEKEDYTVEVYTQGDIRAHHNTALTAQVGGRVMKISPKFEDGAFFQKGDVLVEIDTADYLTEIESAKAQLARAESLYAQEQARAKQALLNWKDAGFDDTPSDLVLRKPQLRQTEADVTSAQAALERAERNLSRTKVKAPYNGRVRLRTVGIGQQVGSNTTLGEIFTTDIAEVRLPITTRDLEFYSPPNKPLTEHSAEAKEITLTSIVASHSTSQSWKARIIRAEGELDADSRQIFVIARIQDPFGLKADTPALYIGQPVRAAIPAHVLKDVYTVSREHLSDLNEIIVIREGKIVHLDIEPIWSTQDDIIFRDTVQPGDQLAISHLPYAPEGAPVEITPDPSKAQSDAAAQIDKPTSRPPRRR